MQASWRPALYFLAVLCVAAPARAQAPSPSPAPAAAPGAAPGISDGVVRIGLVLDMSGPYADVTGAGSATAARLAVEDFGGTVAGVPIELLVEDHHNSPDRALSIARDWFDNRRVDAVLDVSGSSEGLLVQRYGDTRHKIVSLSAPGASRLSNEACTATSIHYVADSYAIAHTLGSTLLARGDNSWFFITVDYSFGYDVERDTAAVVTGGGGQVVGQARHPLETKDFGSYLARARESGAKVIAFANGGSDIEGALRQAVKLGMVPGPQILTGLIMRINTVDAIGLQATQGMMLSESFYWDLDDATRAWSHRFFDRTKKMPNALQAGLYSSVLHYLKAVAKTGTDDTDAVLKAMRDTPVDDVFAHNGHIRPDGTMVHDLRVFQVKTPAESRYPWDYYRLVATVPGDQAFRPLAQSRCPFLKP